MRIVAGSFGFLLCGGVAWPAHATGELPLPVRVERELGTEACPAESELAARIERIRGRRSNSVTAYRVTFSRRGEALSATIRSGDGASSRVLTTEDPTCQALAQASAVALALLLDAEAPPAPPPATPASSERTKQPASSSHRNARHDALGTIAAGGTALIGVVRPVAPVIGAELGTQVSAFRASLGAVWMIPQNLPLGPGSVRETLAAASARVCLAPWRDVSLRLDLCTGGWLGVRVAKANGYTENTENRSTWLGVPLELSLAELSAPLGWEVAAGALLSIPNRHYTVAGFGAAYESPPVGILISLRGVAAWPW